MTNANFDDDDEKPLDPVMERVRRKMIRLQLISAGTIVVSLMAVLGAVVYKATKEAPQNMATPPALVAPDGAPLSLTAEIAGASRFEGASLDGNRVLISVSDAAGNPSLHVFDMASGRVIATIAVKAK